MMIAGLLGGAVTAVLGVALGFALLASDAYVLVLLSLWFI